MSEFQASKFKVTPNHSFFFDANIWIILYFSSLTTKKAAQDKFSNLFKNILNNECNIYLSSLVLSEVINTVFRIDFKTMCQKRKNNIKDFKRDYKKSSRYKEQANFIKNQIEKKILPYSKFIDDNISNMGLSNILCSLKNHDFNDAYYIEMMKNHNKLKKSYFVSQDKDFKKSGIKLIY